MVFPKGPLETYAWLLYLSVIYLEAVRVRSSSKISVAQIDLPSQTTCHINCVGAKFLL